MMPNHEPVINVDQIDLCEITDTRRRKDSFDCNTEDVNQIKRKKLSLDSSSDCSDISEDLLTKVVGGYKVVKQVEAVDVDMTNSSIHSSDLKDNIMNQPSDIEDIFNMLDEDLVDAAALSTNSDDITESKVIKRNKIIPQQSEAEVIDVDAVVLPSSTESPDNFINNLMKKSVCSCGGNPPLCEFCLHQQRELLATSSIDDIFDTDLSAEEVIDESISEKEPNESLDDDIQPSLNNQPSDMENVFNMLDNDQAQVLDDAAALSTNSDEGNIITESKVVKKKKKVPQQEKPEVIDVDIDVLPSKSRRTFKENLLSQLLREKLVCSCGGNAPFCIACVYRRDASNQQIKKVSRRRKMEVIDVDTDDSASSESLENYINYKKKTPHEKFMEKYTATTLCSCDGNPPLCMVCGHQKREYEKQQRLLTGDTDEVFGGNLSAARKTEKARILIEESVSRKEHIATSQSLADDEEQIMLGSDPPPETEIDIWHTIDKTPSISLPNEVADLLKPHQIEGIRFLWKNVVARARRSNTINCPLGCGLAHSMGLGKTAQIVIFLQLLFRQKHVSKALIITPKSTLYNWDNEINKWNINRSSHTVHCLSSKLSRSDKLQMLSEWYDTSEDAILVTSYSQYVTMVNWDVGHRVEIMLRNPGPDIVILDEGHALKNQSSVLNQCLSLIATSRRILLTGTPLQNSLEEYFVMVNFIIPGYFTRGGFINYFQKSIVAGQRHDSTELEISIMKKRSYILLQELRPFIIRRDQSILISDLPEKQEFVIMLPLSDIQKELYNKFRKSHSSDSTRDSKIYFFYSAVMTKLCAHPDTLRNFVIKGFDTLGDKEWARALLDVDYEKNHMTKVETSIKLSALLTIIKYCVINDEKILVFSQYTSIIDFIKPYIKSVIGDERFVFQLTGHSSDDSRRASIDNFQKISGRAAVFLISTRAGGVGINLNTAHKAVLYDVSYNPAQDQQAIFRNYRYGQVNKVNIYRFCSDGTPESAVFNLSVAKEWIQKKVVDDSIPSRNHVLYTNLRDRVFSDMQKDMLNNLVKFSDKFKLETAKCLNSDPALRFLVETFQDRDIPEPTRILRHESLFIEDSTLQAGEAEKQAYESFRNQVAEGTFESHREADTDWSDQLLSIANDLIAAPRA